MRYNKNSKNIRYTNHAGHRTKATISLEGWLIPTTISLRSRSSYNSNLRLKITGRLSTVNIISSSLNFQQIYNIIVDQDIHILTAKYVQILKIIYAIHIKVVFGNVLQFSFFHNKKTGNMFLLNKNI